MKPEVLHPAFLILVSMDSRAIRRILALLCVSAFIFLPNLMFSQDGTQTCTLLNAGVTNITNPELYGSVEGPYGPNGSTLNVAALYPNGVTNFLVPGQSYTESGKYILVRNAWFWVSGDVPGSSKGITTKYQVVPGNGYSAASPVFFFVVYPGGKGMDDDSDGDGCNGNNTGCPSCGMVTWDVSEPYVSLWLHDEPLSYQPAIGQRISFNLSFKQSDYYAGYNTNVFSVGRRWDCGWISYVTQDYNSNNVVYFSGGRQRTFYTTNDYLTNTRLTGDITNGFTLGYPDGSKDVYGFIVTNVAATTQGMITNFVAAFLTERWNSHGQKTTLIYAPYNKADPVVRLEYVIDGDGRTNSIYYDTNNAYSTNLISQVVDPFGRSAFLQYDDEGHLTNIIDVVSNSSAITYDTNDLPTRLTTPYGTTTFSLTSTSGFSNIPQDGRSVLITQPDGGHQLYLYTNNASGVASSYPTNQVPDTSPFSNTFDDSDLNVRDTFYWGPRQYANLSTTNISQLTADDFHLARMQHWLTSTNSYVGNTLSLERDPSPDTNGTIEGQIIWYDYTGKTNTEYEGTQVDPLFVAKVLPDGSTQFTRSLRNDLGAVTNEISTYSVNGTVLLRTNVYVYAPNGIDLLATTNALGVQVSSNNYNAYHEVTTNYDAINEQTVYTYNADQQLTSTTLPSGLVTTNIYDSDGLLATQIDVGYATNIYTYTNDLVLTHTDARGLITTNTWDDLNRLVSIAFPDSTSIKDTYDKLDLIQTVDRMGFTNSFGYDSMRRKIAETNALGAVTIYNYCSCGALDSIMDAASNITQFFYDNQGNLTNTLYADGYSVTRTYNLLKQVVNTTDSGDYSVTNTYNNQGLLTSVSNAFGLVQSTTYDILDRSTNTVDANGVSVATTYDNLNRPLARSYPDDGVEHWGYAPNVSRATSYTNQIGDVTSYAYDAMGRQTNNAVLGVTTNSFIYDGAGDLLTLTDGKNQSTSWLYDQYGNVTNKLDANYILMFVDQYDADNRLTNRWSAAKGTTVYRYDAAGNLTNVDYSSGTVTMPSIYMAYDVLNRLTNMVDAVGDTAYSYNSVGELLSENGPWTDDTVSYTYDNRLRTELTLSQPSGSWSQSYGYDVARRLTNVTSQAGSFGYQYAGSGPSMLVSRLTLPDGAYITNGYDSVARLLSTELENSTNTDLDSYAYGYNLAGQRTNVIRTAGDFVNYTYDNAGELLTAQGHESGGTSRLQEQLGYVYDAAGNLNFRTNNALIQAFAVNDLNELTAQTNSGTLTVAGTTTIPATTVTVNGLLANHYADATFALGGFSLVNGTNTYTAIGQDSNGRLSTNVSSCYLSTTNAYSYDLNGNLLSDGCRNFTYDDENQLIGVSVANVYSNNFVYDGRFRRRIEKDYAWESGAWVETNEIHFIYDGDVVIQERDGNNNPQVTYTRGDDLSGTLQGAGGIGGLLARTDRGQEIPGSPTTAYYHADGNGNITMLIYANQIIAAKYLYDPYGNMLSISGPLATLNVYRFSSKAWNDDSGLYYFGRRYYDPASERWLNRDPVGERGGLNLYNFVDNNPINGYDALGFETRWREAWTGTVDRWRKRVVGWTPWETSIYTSTPVGNCMCMFDEKQWSVQLTQEWGFETKTRWEESRSWAYEIIPRSITVGEDISEFIFSDEYAAAKAAYSAMKGLLVDKAADVIFENTGWKEVPGTRTTFTPFVGPEITDGPPEPSGKVRTQHSVQERPCSYHPPHGSQVESFP